MNNKSTTINRILIFLSIFILLVNISEIIENVYFYFSFTQAYEPIFRIISSIFIILFLSVFKKSEKKHVIPAIIFFVWGFEWIIYKIFLDRILINGFTNWWNLEILFNFNFNFISSNTINGFLCLALGALSIVSGVGIIRKWKTKAFVIASLCLAFFSTLTIANQPPFIFPSLFHILYLAEFTFILFFKDREKIVESDDFSYNSQPESDE